MFLFFIFYSLSRSLWVDCVCWSWVAYFKGALSRSPVLVHVTFLEHVAPRRSAHAIDREAWRLDSLHVARPRPDGARPSCAASWLFSSWLFCFQVRVNFFVWQFCPDLEGSLDTYASTMCSLRRPGCYNLPWRWQWPDVGCSMRNCRRILRRVTSVVTSRVWQARPRRRWRRPRRRWSAGICEDNNCKWFALRTPYLHG